MSVVCVPSTSAAVSPAMHTPSATHILLPHMSPLPCTPPAMHAPTMHAPCHTCLPAMHTPSCHARPLWTKWLTDRCRNITYPQLHLRAVITWIVQNLFLLENYVLHFWLWRKLSIKWIQPQLMTLIYFLIWPKNNKSVLGSFVFVSSKLFILLATWQHQLRIPKSLKNNTGLSFVWLIFPKCQSYQWVKNTKLHPICMKRFCCRYQYAGLQDVDECYCGNSYGKHGNSLNVNVSRNVSRISQHCRFWQFCTKCKKLIMSDKDRTSIESIMKFIPQCSLQRNSVHKHPSFLLVWNSKYGWGWNMPYPTGR